MASRRSGGWSKAAVLLLCAGCGGGDQASEASPRTASLAPTSVRNHVEPAPARIATRALPSERGPVVAAPNAEAAPIAARPLFQRLPRETLAALRLPRLDRLGEAADRTAISNLLAAPELAALRGPAEQGLQQAFAEFFAKVPELAPLLVELKGSAAELVVAWLSVDPLAFAGGAAAGKLPLRAALLLDAGASADRIDHALEPLLARVDESAAPGGAWQLVGRTAAGWQRRLRADGAQLDFEREASQFVLLIGPDDGHEARPLPPLALADSFAASEVVRASAPPRAGTTAVAEAFLDLDRAWQLCREGDSPSLNATLALGGFTSIRGVSATCSLAETGLDECLRLIAPEGKDLLTRVFTARQLDPTLARWLPADAEFASLQCFDLAALFDGVRELLPAELRAPLDGFLADAKTREGIDLEQDLIRNLGPTFATSGVGSLATAFSGANAAEWALAIELQDGARLRRMVDQALRKSGMAAHVRACKVGGQSISRCEPMPLPIGMGGAVVSFAPQWWIGDRVLLFAISDQAMERALAAGADAAARGPTAIAAALAAQGQHLFGLSYDASLGANGLTLARRTASGLEIASNGGGGALTTGAALLLGGVAPAIAIPKLLAARVDANEQAAMANLRAIASAQAQFQREARVDSDGDGCGEYATLAELTGATAPRGGGKGGAEALLSERLQPDATGSAERSGYRYRIDLPTALRRGGGPIPAIVAERAELEFVAIAWPVDPGTTGARVFALGSDGSLWSSDNRGENQGYAGLERMPPPEACNERDQSRRVAGVTAVRRGRDDGVWLELE